MIWFHYARDNRCGRSDKDKMNKGKTGTEREKKIEVMCICNKAPKKSST